MDFYAGTFIAIIVGVLEMTVVFWIYGLDNFLNDVEFMIGLRPGLYWRLCWFVITPLTMMAILITYIVNFQLPTYGELYIPYYAQS